MLREMQHCGTICNYGPFSGGARVNWLHICFASKHDAQRALLKNGEQLSPTLIIGVKPLDPRQRCGIPGTQPLPAFPAFSSPFFWREIKRLLLDPMPLDPMPLLTRSFRSPSDLYALFFYAANMPDNPPIPAARAAVQRITASDLSTATALAAPHRSVVGKIAHYVFGI